MGVRMRLKVATGQIGTGTSGYILGIPVEDLTSSSSPIQLFSAAPRATRSSNDNTRRNPSRPIATSTLHIPLSMPCSPATSSVHRDDSSMTCIHPTSHRCSVSSSLHLHNHPVPSTLHRSLVVERQTLEEPHVPQIQVPSVNHCFPRCVDVRCFDDDVNIQDWLGC